MRIRIDLDEETGMLAWLHDWRAEEKLTGQARVALESLHSRYKALQHDVVDRARESEAKAAEMLLEESNPKVRVITRRLA